MKDRETIAFLGIGLMGLPMARNLLRAGHTVRAWNRSAIKAQELVGDGAVVCDSPAEAVSSASVVISMLSDGSVVAGLVAAPAVISALSPETLWVDMSSTKPDEARACAATLKARGVGFLDAPVSGGTKGAEGASLAIMVGGQADRFEAVRPILADLGRPVLVGPVGSGQLAKLANQAIVAVTIAAVAEATLLLEKGGADPAAVRDALVGGFADSTILQQHGDRMSRRDFEPGGLSRLQLKDLENVLSEAGEFGLDLPAVKNTRDRFATYVSEMNGAERDHSGLFEELLSRNGLGQS